MENRISVSLPSSSSREKKKRKVSRTTFINGEADDTKDAMQGIYITRKEFRRQQHVGFYARSIV